MDIRYNYIVIEGNIGAGKTTLATRIAEEYNGHLILEQFADNPFLPKFYREPEKYSFQLELSFLASRYKQLNEELSPGNLFSSFKVADYYFTKSLVFASATLSGDEFNLYRQIFYIIYGTLPKPDIYVYLHLNTGKLLENIRKRGRDYEKLITAEYLQKIQDSYFTFFRQNQDNRYLILDINNIDFVASEEDYRKVTGMIFEKEYRNGLNMVIL